MVTEGLLIAMITGILSIITILIKYRLDNNKMLKEIQLNNQESQRQDKKRDENIAETNKKLNKIEIDLISLKNRIDETNKAIQDIKDRSDTNDALLYRFSKLQVSLDKCIYKDIKHEEHNGDLDSALNEIKLLDDFLNTPFFQEFRKKSNVIINKEEENKYV